MRGKLYRDDYAPLLDKHFCDMNADAGSALANVLALLLSRVLAYKSRQCYTILPMCSFCWTFPAFASNLIWGTGIGELMQEGLMPLPLREPMRMGRK